MLYIFVYHRHILRVDGRFIRGNLHWPVRRKQPEFRICVLAFDVESEKYHEEIDLPDGMRKLPSPKDNNIYDVFTMDDERLRSERVLDIAL